MTKKIKTITLEISLLLDTYIMYKINNTDLSYSSK